MNRPALLLLTAAACSLLLASAAPAAPPAQRTFATAGEAVAALFAAVEANDTGALLEILGANAKPIIDSGDPVADAAMRQRFVESYREAHELVPGPDDSKILQTGNDRWPLPIPLVDTAGGWRFDTDAGEEEILNRRIGKNELSAIQTCLAYVDAQREYHDLNPQGEALPSYAQRLASSTGEKDGLYWDTTDGEPASPLGEEFARARAEGYEPGDGTPIPFHGYYFRILDAQGKSAPGGAYDYVVRGKMIGGFALVAYPAEYDASGVMTFIVNHEGVVYEQDLGPDTKERAQAMKAFDPDESWRKVEADAAPDQAQPAAGPAAAPAAQP